jgi:protoporphyrinogen oxidase
VGAGAGGLAAAYDLVRAGCRVTILESEAQVGGLASGFRQPHWDWSVEKYYHHWFASDRHILGLIRELGWQDQVVFHRPVTVVYHQERFYRWILRWRAALPGHTFLDRLRVGAVIAYLKYLAAWPRWSGSPPTSGCSAGWAGAATRPCGAAVVGKFGPHYQQVNMAWFWLASGLNPAIGDVCGFQAFMDRLASVAGGAELRLSMPVQRLRPGRAGLTLHMRASEEQFDQCLVTTSPGPLARLAPGLAGPYLQDSGAAIHGAVVRCWRSSSASPSRATWHNLPKASFPFHLLVEHTNFVSPEHFRRRHIVYCGDYLDPITSISH